MGDVCEIGRGKEEEKDEEGAGEKESGFDLKEQSDSK